MMQKFRILGTGLVLVTFAACGGNQSTNTKDTTAAPTTTTTTTTSTPSAQVSNNITITANDQMQFSDTVLTAKAGAITVTLKNIGKLPKIAMGHDFIVFKSGTDVAAFIKEAATAKADDNYIPADQKGNVVANTRVLGPGESQTITFTLQPGTYDYLCSFPAHAATMHGKLTVQ